jgi:hypothetical protein
MLFCLVHGAWHDKACWQPLVEELAHRGHDCIVPVLPLEDDRVRFEDYAGVVAKCLADPRASGARRAFDVLGRNPAGRVRANGACSSTCARR